MPGHLSERFHDFERREVYLDLVASAAGGTGSERAYFLSEVPSAEPPAEAAPPAVRRTLRLRWFTLPRLRLPLPIWA